MKLKLLFIALIFSAKSFACSISGETNPCKNITYRYTTQTGKTNYFWQVPTGGTKVAGGSSSDSYVDVVWNGGLGIVNVTYYNANWTQCSASLNVASPKENPYPTITGASSACEYLGGDKSYTTESNKLDYNWTITGGTILSYADNKKQANVRWTSPGTGSISVSYRNPSTGCTSPRKYMNVIVHAKPSANPSITGPTLVCADNNSSTTHSYSITPAGQTSYTWFVQGGSIASGAGSNAVAINWTKDTGLSVSGYYTNSNGCRSESATLSVSASNPIPPSPSGSTYVALNTSGYVYTTIYGKSNYQWSISGGIIDTPTNQYSVSVTWYSTSSKSICVSYNEGGGCQSLYKCTSVSSGGSSRLANEEGTGEITESEMVLAALEEELDAVRVYPVPAKGELTIEIPTKVEEGSTITLMDLTGKTVFNGSKGKGESKKVVDVSQFTNGWYLARIVSKSGTTSIKVLIEN